MALTDQEIRDMDYDYIPEQQWLLNPFEPRDGMTSPGFNDGTPADLIGQTSNTYNYGIPNAYNYDSDRTSTAARMPNQYIDYLDKNRHTGKNNLIEKSIGFLKNTSIGQGVGAAYGILQDIMPMNQTAIMNNEMLGQGFAVDNTGKLVRVDQGDVDTSGNIMAGYNVSKMDEDTFEDRLNSLGNMSVKGRKKRRAAIEAAREAWRRAKIKTGNVYHAKYKDRPDYRMLDTKYEEEMNDPKMLGDLPVYDPEIDYEKTGTPGYIRSRGANIDAGHWVGKKQHGHGPITVEDIKGDVTGMYTDDPSGIGDGGNDPAPGPSYDASDLKDFMARGGRVGLNLGGLAPRGSYFNGGLASLWRR